MWCAEDNYNYMQGQIQEFSMGGGHKHSLRKADALFLQNMGGMPLSL